MVTATATPSEPAVADPEKSPRVRPVEVLPAASVAAALDEAAAAEVAAAVLEKLLESEVKAVALLHVFPKLQLGC